MRRKIGLRKKKCLQFDLGFCMIHTLSRTSLREDVLIVVWCNHLSNGVTNWVTHIMFLILEL